MTKAIGAVRPLGTHLSNDTLKDDLGRYCQLALEWGASGAMVVSANDVVIDERVRLKCTVPRCMRAGETPHCPPNALDLDLVRKAIGRYRCAVLIKCDVGPIEEYAPGHGTTKEEQRRVLSFHEKSGKVVCELERQAYKDGYHLAMGLGGGSCKDYLCKGLTCQALDSGRCRFPNQARPAMEALGIDVIDLLGKVGWRAYALLEDLNRIPCGISVGIVFVA